MMRSIFVVEGQTEQIFLTKFIEQLALIQKYTIQLNKFHNREIIELGRRGHPEEESTHIIQIINVENDDKVLSYIEENLKKFVEKGFSAIFGLRDRYTGDKSKTPINPLKVDVSTKSFEEQYKVKVEVTIAIEEVEAWFLAVPSFFSKYDPALTLEIVNEVCEINLATADVELIAHPAQLINKVLSSVGMEYKKKLNDSHKITHNIDYEQLYLEKSQFISSLKKTINHLDYALS